MIIHFKRWYVYMNEEEALIKGVYSVEFSVLKGIRFFGEW